MLSPTTVHARDESDAKNDPMLPQLRADRNSEALQRRHQRMLELTHVWKRGAVVNHKVLRTYEMFDVRCLPRPDT